MKKLFLLKAIFVLSVNSIVAQDAAFELYPIKDFYHRFVKMNSMDSIKYKQEIRKREKEIARLEKRGVTGCSLNIRYGSFIEDYYKRKWKRDRLKIEADSIVKKALVKNKFIGKDSLSVIQVTAVHARNSKVHISYPQYGYSTLDIKSLDIKLSVSQKDLPRDKVYYFLEESFVRYSNYSSDSNNNRSRRSKRKSSK